MTEIDYRIRTVGQEKPTTENAPHGYALRTQPSHEWSIYRAAVPSWLADCPNAEWYPLPAPPTEHVPEPEKWAAMDVDSYHGKWGIAMRRGLGLSGSMPEAEARAAVARLNWQPNWEGYEETVGNYIDDWGEGGFSTTRDFVDMVRQAARLFLSPPEVPS